MSGFAIGESHGAPRSSSSSVHCLCRATARSARARGFCDPDTTRHVYSARIAEYRGGPGEGKHEGTCLPPPTASRICVSVKFK